MALAIVNVRKEVEYVTMARDSRIELSHVSDRFYAGCCFGCLRDGLLLKRILGPNRCVFLSICFRYPRDGTLWRQRPEGMKSHEELRPGRGASPTLID